MLHSLFPALLFSFTPDINKNYMHTEDADGNVVFDPLLEQALSPLIGTDIRIFLLFSTGAPAVTVMHFAYKAGLQGKGRQW